MLCGLFKPCVKTKCWLGSTVPAPPAGGRGSANGALRGKVLPARRCRDGRVPACFGAWCVCVGVPVTAAGAAGGARESVVLRRPCLHHINDAIQSACGPPFPQNWL